MRVALLFPGQGSQHPGMFASLIGEPAAHGVFEEAGAVLGYDPRAHDDADSLASTRHAQLALLVAGTASARVLAARGAHFDAVAGHSVGAFAAAVAAGAIEFADALRLVRERATAMGELFPRGYGMAAVVGLREAEAQRIAINEDRVYVANVNAPRQLVLAGEDAALERALAAARRAGANRAERLNVAVPSHCPLLAPVQARLERLLAETPVHAPRLDYVGSVRPRIIRDAQRLREDLAAGVAHEVRWHDATTLLVESGAALLVEAAPGRVLADLARAAFPGVRAVAFEDAGAASAALLAARAGDA
jgi:malonate decarboxylase epsilon subunit